MTTNFNKGVVPLPVGGNAFAIMGAVSDAIRRANPDNHRAIVQEYHAQAMSGDYNNLILVSSRYVTFKDEEFCSEES